MSVLYFFVCLRTKRLILKYILILRLIIISFWCDGLDVDVGEVKLLKLFRHMQFGLCTALALLPESFIISDYCMGCT